MVLSVLGIVLLLPILGVETFSLPVIGTAYLAGQLKAITMLDMMRYGPDYLFLLSGLVMLALGAILFAVAIWRSHLLPKWAGVCFAIGLAWSIWQQTYV